MMNGDLSPLILNFMGQVVQVTTVQRLSTTALTPEGPITETYPVSYEGILTDEDDKYLYLAKTAGNVSLAIDRTKVVAIEVVEPEPERDVYTEILDQMPTPNKNEDAN